MGEGVSKVFGLDSSSKGFCFCIFNRLSLSLGGSEKVVGCLCRRELVEASGLFLCFPPVLEDSILFIARNSKSFFLTLFIPPE